MSEDEGSRPSASNGAQVGQGHGRQRQGDDDGDHDFRAEKLSPEEMRILAQVKHFSRDEAGYDWDDYLLNFEVIDQTRLSERFKKMLVFFTLSGTARTYIKGNKHLMKLSFEELLKSLGSVFKQSTMRGVAKFQAIQQSPNEGVLPGPFHIFGSLQVCFFLQKPRRR